MSTATLLIVTARLRSIARADGRPHPASSAIPSSGRSRVTGDRVMGDGASWYPQFRQQGAGNRPLRLNSPQRSISPLAPVAGTRLTPFSRARVLVMASLFLIIGSQPARAQQAEQPAVPPTLELPVLRVEAKAPQDAPQSEPRKIGGAAPKSPCVIVDIAGDRAGHLDCATQALTEAARIAQSEARAGIDAPVPKAGSPDAQLGVANQTATRLRMGSAFGNSVHAERPASRPPRAPRP